MNFKMFLQLPREELAEIYTNLGSWNWDERLGQEPDRWDQLDIHQKSQIISGCMKFINQTIGEYECLKYWNVRKSKRMSEEEFDTWWITYITRN